MRTRLSSQVGPAVRKLRLSKGLTLAQLSKRSGIPLSTLSKLELAQVALTYDKLVRLCRALEVDIEQTMQVQPAAFTAIGRRAVLRAGEGEDAASGPHRARFLGAELLGKSLSPVVLEVQANSLDAHGPLRELPGEACLVVLEGAAVLHSEIYAPLELSAGDGVYFDGRARHAILAGEAGPARVLLVAAGDITVSPSPNPVCRSRTGGPSPRG
jgi:transcriptional regulator with XRE-family HTH domain